MFKHIPSFFAVLAYLWYMHLREVFSDETVFFTTGACSSNRWSGVDIGMFNHSTHPFFINMTMPECLKRHTSLQILLEQPRQWSWPFPFYDKGCIVDNEWAYCNGFPCPYTLNFTACY